MESPQRFYLRRQICAHNVAPDHTRTRIPHLAGAIAQLGERLNGIQEVRGSTPLGSTN